MRIRFTNRMSMPGGRLRTEPTRTIPAVTDTQRRTRLTEALEGETAPE